MRNRLALLIVPTLISAVSGANAVEQNSAQADLSAEAGRISRSKGNAHDIPRDEKAEAAKLYEQLMGRDAIPKTSEDSEAKISN